MFRTPDGGNKRVEFRSEKRETGEEMQAEGGGTTGFIREVPAGVPGGMRGELRRGGSSGKRGFAEHIFHVLTRPVNA